MSYTPTTLIVQQLLKYLSENPDLKGAFEEAFKNAQKDHPWLALWKEYDVHSLDNYFRYMDEFVHWVPTENRQGTDVYNHICFFYFILDTSPLLEYQSTIHPSSRSPWTWLSDWLIKYAKEMGRWMDSPESFDPKNIEEFVNNPAYRDRDVDNFYEQYPEPPASEGPWKTFNEFFARHIDPKLRPIYGPDDPTVIVCPADCAFDEPSQWPVQDDSTVKLKGVPWSIKQLLDEGSVSDPHSPKFSGGVFTHAFLNTTNYHRLHAPVSGKVVEAKVIPGLCFLEVVAELKPGRAPNGPGSERLVMRRPMLSKEVTARNVEAPNSPGYQFLQARALILIESEIGLVAVLPIGMAQVSSVVLSVKKGDTVKKGQEIAFFQLGGSDVVMVFQKGANVQLNPANSDGEVFTKFGRQIGTATPVQGF